MINIFQRRDAKLHRFLLYGRFVLGWRGRKLRY